MGAPTPLAVLPPAFYGGKARARRAIALAVIVLVVSVGALAGSGRIDLLSVLGPHVARSEWAFTMTGARALNGLGLTGRGITVCVVDSGLDAIHPDFALTHIVAWRDFVNFRPGPYDDSGHGTSMTGLIAADGGLRGVAPEVQLIVAKVVNSAGEGSPENVAAGIHFCVDPGNGLPGADVISISLGSKAHLFVESKVEQAAEWATARGVFVVASAGNDGTSDDGDVGIPANAPLVISVGAVDSSGIIAPFSSIGSSENRSAPNLKPEVVAPGVRLVSTGLGARYLTTSGTSPAAAVVAGILALLLQAKPSLRPGIAADSLVRVKTAIAAASRRAIDQVLPHDPWYGYGIIDGPAVLALL